MGFKEVILLGIDHDYKLDDDEINILNKQKKLVVKKSLSSHFIKDYLPLNSEVHVDLEAMENGYRLAKQTFENKGRRIVNASPGSKLQVYDIVDFDRLFDIPQKSS